MRKYFAVILSVPKNFAIKLSSYMIQKMRQIAFSQIEHLSNENMRVILPHPTHHAIGGVNHVHLGEQPLLVEYNVVDNVEKNFSYQLPVNVVLEDNFRWWK